MFHPDTAAFFLLRNDFAEANAGHAFGTICDRRGPRPRGRVHPSTATMSLGTQLLAAPDVVFTFSAAGDIPVAGLGAASMIASASTYRPAL